ncbi:uncharacterized protein LOC120126172 [Hibiscus syriacus]|uniref:uncharacterized protein LOC120126172 n=1 Tax=Hibiscus syriacus TaxID=106335 RepID=UPI001921276D|nr:uncharacterized protein LOC120126172 [Hibiscus syriacus]
MEVDSIPLREPYCQLPDIVPTDHRRHQIIEPASVLRVQSLYHLIGLYHLFSVVEGLLRVAEPLGHYSWGTARSNSIHEPRIMVPITPIYAMNFSERGISNSGFGRVRVSNPIGLDVLVEQVHCRCPIELQGEKFFDVFPDELLGLLSDHELYAKFGKCELWLIEMAFLGHVVATNGIQVDPQKINPVLECQPPNNITEKGVPFIWNEKHQERFDKLKEILAQAPILIQLKSGCLLVELRVELKLLGKVKQLQADRQLRDRILHEAYCRPLSIYPGSNKMYQELFPLYWWSGMKREVYEFVAKCLGITPGSLTIAATVLYSVVKMRESDDGLCN